MQTNTQDNDTSNVSEKSEQIREYGQVILKENNSQHHIFLLSIIGEIEGHEQSPGNVKTTKYEHVLPLLAMAEDNQEIDGILVLLNTMGGDVEAGIAIAEMIASISKPTVSLVLGGSHSIGVPLAVSADYSFIVPSGTMIIHPVRDVYKRQAEYWRRWHSSLGAWFKTYIYYPCLLYTSRCV